MMILPCARLRHRLSTVSPTITTPRQQGAIFVSPIQEVHMHNYKGKFISYRRQLPHNQCCGSGSQSGSRSFYHQAKIVRKTLIPTVLWLFFDFLCLKNDVNVPSKRNKQKHFFKISFLLESWKSMTKIAGSGSISQRHGSADPDPHQNVMDPQHCPQPSRRHVVGFAAT
jgi:hypothetical protein